MSCEADGGSFSFRSLKRQTAHLEEIQGKNMEQTRITKKKVTNTKMQRVNFMSQICTALTFYD